MSVDPMTPILPPAYRPPKRLGALFTATAILVTLTTLAELIYVWTSWHTYGVVKDYLTGSTSVTESDLYQADAFTALAGFSYIAGVLVAGVLFIIWLWRGRTNSELMSPYRHRIRRGWVIGSWFCPIVNLWFPYRILQDVWKASLFAPAVDGTQRKVPDNAIIGCWWGCFLGSSFLDQINARFVLREITVENLRVSAALDTLAGLLTAAAAALIIIVMARITRAQEARVVRPPLIQA
jgi:hypothetical protein